MASARLRLSAALSDNERTKPVLDGRVRPAGIDLVATVLSPGEMFWRQLKFADFDVSEMSLSSLFIAASHGDYSWVALPIFTVRQFFHTGVLVRADAGIDTPQQLIGKRVGVPEYQQTSAIWARGILQHEFGVHPTGIDWFIERTPERSHGGATGFRAPPGVRTTQIPVSTNIGEMLLRSELDATLFYISEPGLIDRSSADLRRAAAVRPLFANPAAEALRYFRKTALYPINHALVLRRTLLEEQPWLALNLLAAFTKAKEIGLDTSRSLLQSYVEVGLVDAPVAAALTKDPAPYGVRANRAELEAISRFLKEQGLAERQVEIAEVFAKSTLEV